MIRAAKSGLSIVLFALSMMSAGVGEAWSQNALITICNRTNVTAWIAVTAHPRPGDSRFLISGWYDVPRATCTNIKSVARGWVYLYGETDQGDYWPGRDQRFCVQYPGPFDRYISDDFNCSGNLLKSFTGYYVDVPSFTWILQ